MTEEELKCQYCGKPAKMYTSPCRPSEEDCKVITGYDF